jgi:2-dehydropantoate 2-reductase
MLNVAIIGLGAIGGTVAARAKSLSTNVIYGVTGREATAERAREHGIRVRMLGADEPHVFLNDVFATTEELPIGLDLVFLATKSEAAVETAKAVLPKLKPTGVVVALQNGYILDDLLEVLHETRLAAASVVWSASLREDGTCDVTGPGNFVLGGLPHTYPFRVVQAAELLGHTFPVKRTHNIAGALWSKMCINSCITTLGAITGLTFGQQTAHRDFRELYLAIITETLRVGTAHGIVFEKLNDRLDPFALSNLRAFPPKFIKHFIISTMGKRYKGGESSMLQSLRRGRTPEIDSINGVVSRWGKHHHIPTPLHDRMIALVHEIAAGDRNISTDNLRELYPIR